MNHKPTFILDKNTVGKNELDSSIEVPLPASQPIPATYEIPPESWSHTGLDWPIRLGLIGSLIWIILLALYISGAQGWYNLADLPMEILGSFLEGAFAPLAFLWFVLGYFSQQKELSQNTQAIRMQYLEMQKSAVQAVIQADAISASEVHARRESFISVAESVKAQLGAIMGFLYISSQGSNATGIVPPEEMSALWHAMGSRDYEIFSRHMLELTYKHGERYGYKLLYGTEIRSRHTENFIFNFERLLEAAKECDSNGMIHDAVHGSAHGHTYDRIIQIRNTPPAGFTLGVYDFDPDAIDD